MQTKRLTSIERRDMTNKQELDYTMMSTFLNCRRRYDFRMNRGLVGKVPPTPLAFGGAIHKALDSWYADKDVDKAVAVFKENFVEDLDADNKRTHQMGEWILRNYHTQYQDQPWELVQSEMGFVLDFKNGKKFIGRIDKIVKWGDCLWVVDHKAQPLYSCIKTPKGSVRMGNIKVGDYVLGSNGKATKVLGVYPQGIVDCYRVTFEDGSAVDCSKEHLWKVKEQHYSKWRVMTTEHIKDRMDIPLSKDSYKFQVPICEPVQYKNTSKGTINPYLLGVILGDGCVSGHVVEISIGNEDKEAMLKNLKSTLPKDCVIRETSGDNHSYIIKSKIKGKNKLIRELKKLNLMGLRGEEKFVPWQYLTFCVSDRLKMLQGLMDTDGCCYKGYLMFDNASELLCDNVVELVRSLGGTARMRRRTGTNKQAYRVQIRLPEGIIPFRLQRKIDKIRTLKTSMCRYIKSIKRVGKETMQCIKVDAEDSLYLTSDYILTHNTTSQLGAQYFKSAEPNLQFTGYTWAAKKLGFNVVGIILDAILVAKGLLPGASKNYNLTALARYDVYRNAEHLKEWEDTAEAIMADIEVCEATNKWYPNFDMCTYFGECPYRRVCKEDSDIRERIIETDYRVEHWNPIKEEKWGN